METSRINSYRENTILKISFKMPILLWVIFGLCGAGMLTFVILCFIGINNGTSLTYLPPIFIFLFFFLMLLWLYFCIKFSKVEITTNRIVGTFWIFLYKKQISNRLDEIDSVKLGSFLGINGMKIKFTEGHFWLSSLDKKTSLLLLFVADKKRK